MTRRDCIWALLLGCLSAGYFILFRYYGFQLEDEGTLLFQFSRVANGQFPYRDFFAGYTPGYFALGAFLLNYVGNSTVAVRLCLVVVNVLSAVSLYGITREVAGKTPAIALTVLWVVFLPVYPGEFASFNVPYPTWFTTLAWMALALGLLRWASGGPIAWLTLVGLSASIAFALKPNAGAFAIAASVWGVALLSDRQGRWDNALAIIASAGMALGVWYAFGFSTSPVDLTVHLGPVFVLSWLCLRRPCAQTRLISASRTWPAMAVLGVSFLPLTLIWALPVVSQLGVSGFLSHVLFIGSDWKQAYYRPYPQPELYALFVVAATVLLGVAGRVLSRRPMSLAVPLYLGIASALALVVWKRGSVLMPESFASSVIWQLENASFWIFPLANWMGLYHLSRLRWSGDRAGEFRTLAVIVAVAITTYLQLYPRSDFMHLITSAQFSGVLGSMIAIRVSLWWNLAYQDSNVRVSRVFRYGLAGIVCLLVGLKVSLVLPSALAWSGESPATIDTPTVEASLEPQASDDLEALARASAYLRRCTEDHEAVFAFPALGGLLYAAGRRSSAPHDYWYPGEPNHSEEKTMVEDLERDPPRFVATLNAGWRTFRGSPRYFRTAGEFVAGNYSLVGRFGRFDLLARRDIAETLETEFWQPGGPRSAVIEQTLAWRRQAALRWMQSISPDEASKARLDPEPARALLMLRAIRDGGNMRAAGWLISGYNSHHSLVREEALRTMAIVAQRYFATRSRWANDWNAESYKPWVANYQRALVELRDAEDRRAVVFARALKEILGDE